MKYKQFIFTGCASNDYNRIQKNLCVALDFQDARDNVVQTMLLINKNFAKADCSDVNLYKGKKTKKQWNNKM